MLNNQSVWHPEHRCLLHQCKHLLDWGGWEMKILHCFREANKVADILIKIGSEGTLGVAIIESRLWELGMPYLLIVWVFYGPDMLSS